MDLIVINNEYNINYCAKCNQMIILKISLYLINKLLTRTSFCR